MSDNWGFFFREFADSPASIRIDLDAGREHSIADLPWLLRVAMPFERVKGQYNPTPREWEVLHAVEDAFTPWVERKLRGVHVASVMYPGERVFFSYVRSESVSADDVRKALGKWKSRTFDVEVRHEPDWDTYFNRLYPDDEDFQWIEDFKLVQYLTEQGDRLETPRQVDFTAVFPTGFDRDQFAEAAAGAGYARAAAAADLEAEGNESNVETEFEAPTSGVQEDEGEAALPLSVTVGRETAVDLNSIYPLTLELHRLAKAHNGRFDGWGCFPVLPSEQG